jgi:hypothetical protein
LWCRRSSCPRSWEFAWRCSSRRHRLVTPGRRRVAERWFGGEYVDGDGPRKLWDQCRCPRLAARCPLSLSSISRHTSSRSMRGHYRFSSRGRLTPASAIGRGVRRPPRMLIPFASIASVSPGRNRRLLLGESDRAPRRRARRTATSAMSPKRSRAGAALGYGSDRADRDSPTLAFGRKRSSGPLPGSLTARGPNRCSASGRRSSPTSAGALERAGSVSATRSRLLQCGPSGRLD